MLHTVGEFAVHYLSLWQMTDIIVTDYETARRLVRQLPDDWRAWGEKLLEGMITEDPITFARLVDFPLMVVVIVAQWAMIHSPPNVLQEEPQWSPVQKTVGQTMSSKLYIPERGYGMGTTQVTPLRRTRDEFETGPSQVPGTQTETVTIPPPVTTVTTDTTQPWRNTIRMRIGAIHTFTLPTRRTSDLFESSEEEDPKEDMEDDDSEDPNEYIVHEPVRSTLGHPSWG